MISKDYILKHAQDIGMQDLSIRALAKKANVSVGTVYNYYPSKKELVGDILNSFWERSLSEDVCRIQAHQGFVDYLNVLFEKTLMNTHNFRDIMYAQLKFLKEDPLNPNVYYMHMKTGLLKVLELDKNIDETIWNESFTQAWFIDFILECMMTQLLKNEPNFSALEMMMRKTLYKGDLK